MIQGNADQVWLALVEKVLAEGNNVFPRGKYCREILGAQARIDMQRPILSLPGRRLGYTFMAAEAHWILSGRNTVADIAHASKAISAFSDNGQMFFGAYGPKIVDQLGHILRVLEADPQSRQAVINIWRENPPDSKDVPCSLSVQFIVRGGLINVVYTMRSSDLWLGAPYDWFNFSMLGAYVLLLLRTQSESWHRIDLGWLYYQAGSCHLYEDNINGASLALRDGLNEARPYAPMQMREFREPRHLLQHLEQLGGRGPASNFMHNWALETRQWRRELLPTDRTQ